MKSSGRFFCALFLVIILANCKSSVNKEGYISWVEDKSHGLVVERKFHDLIFSLQYKPTEYIILKENQDRATYYSEKQEIDNLIHFNFEISTDRKGDALKLGYSSEEAYIDRLNFFSYQAQDNFKLISGKDTLNCVLYHFERSYGLSAKNIIVLGFEKNTAVYDSIKADFTVSFQDPVFLNDKINLTIRQKDIYNIPPINSAALFIEDVSEGKGEELHKKENESTSSLYSNDPSRKSETSKSYISTNTIKRRENETNKSLRINNLTGDQSFMSTILRYYGYTNQKKDS